MGNETDPPREPEGGAVLELLDENDAGKKIPLMLLKRRRQVCAICHYICMNFSVSVIEEEHSYTIYIYTTCLDFGGSSPGNTQLLHHSSNPAP